MLEINKTKIASRWKGVGATAASCIQFTSERLTPIQIRYVPVICIWTVPLKSGYLT